MKNIFKSSLIAFLLSLSQYTFAGTFIDSAEVVSVDKVYKQVRVEEPYKECYIKETVQNSGDGSATNEIIGGVIGASVLIGTGITTGVAQMGRGIANTPSAIGNKASGMDWDEDTRTWIRYDLQAEKKESESKTEEVIYARIY